MPYIYPDRREEFAEDIKALARRVIVIGEVNFCITSLCHEMLKRWGVSYHNTNELVGVLECAKMELYRRIAAPYEDKKIAQNGDIGILTQE